MSTLDTIRQGKVPAGSLCGGALGAFEVKTEAFDGMIEVVEVWVEPNRVAVFPAALGLGIVKYEPDVDGSGFGGEGLHLDGSRDTVLGAALIAPGTPHRQCESEKFLLC